MSRDYQARVTGFAPFTEWKFMNIEFDGFQASECRLQIFANERLAIEPVLYP
jgi:hypothetical protein